MAHVRDDLVGVHVGLGPGTGLPDDKRKIIVELALRHFETGGCDGVAEAFVERSLLHVGERGGALDDPKRTDQRRRHGFATDLEIPQRTLRLRPQYLSAGTSRGPKESVSVRVAVMGPASGVSGGRCCGKV